MYASYVDFRLSPDTIGGVYVCKSFDRGLNWSTPVEDYSSTERPDMPIDRPWIAVDNSGGANDGTVYLVAMSAYWYEGQHHLYLKSSSDRGNTWSPIIQVDDTIFSPGVITASYGAIDVGPDGKVYIATTTDLGATFQKYVVGNVFPLPGKFSGYAISANPTVNNEVVLSWGDQRFGENDVVVSKSSDAGQTWSDPVRVNDDSIGNGVIQDHVWIDFSTNGTLALAWRDRRLHGTGTEVPFDIYASVSFDGGNSFSPNIKLSDASSPYNYLPCCNSFIGVSIHDTILVVNWGDYRNTDWDIYFSKVNIQSINVENISIVPSYDFEIFPNPTTTQLNFELDIQIKQNLKITLINQEGKEISELVNSRDFDAGLHSLSFNIKNLTSGTYFVDVTNKNNASIKKLLIIK